MKLKVVSYNIHKGFMGNRRFVTHDMKEALREACADLVLIQQLQDANEHFDDVIREWPGQSQLLRLANSLWPNNQHQQHILAQGNDQGHAILSRYPITPVREKSSIHLDISRHLLHGLIHPDSYQAVHIICIHFSFLESYRHLKMESLVHYIQHHVPDDEALIIAGDFNELAGSSDRYFNHTMHLEEIFKRLRGRHAYSYPAVMPLMKADRIYSRGLTAEHCCRLDRPIWKRLSGHTPLFARFELEQQVQRQRA